MSQIKLQHDKLNEILKEVYEPQLERVLSSVDYRKKVIVLSGPTCVGKTELSLRLAEELNGEIVNADSMQVYRGMDIGTAKATQKERQRFSHHLIDIREIDEPFTVVDFYHEAQLACESILARGKVPIVTGGTGFYLRALLYGPPEGPPSHPELRQNLENEMEKFSPEAMYDRLEKIDPEYAATITKHDKVKIIRALEIITLTHSKVSSLSWNKRQQTVNFNFQCWFLFRARETIYQRIEERCDYMLKNGLLDEVIALKKGGLLKNKSASSAIGYRQCLEYLMTSQADQDFEILRSEFKKATRHYAKRQFTWFRKEPEFKWLDLDIHDKEIAVNIIATDYYRQEP